MLGEDGADQPHDRGAVGEDARPGPSRLSCRPLAHSAVGFTLDTYAQVLRSADAETAHTLARHILGGGAP